MVRDMEPMVKHRLQTAILLIQFVSMFGVSTDGVFYMNKGARKTYAESFHHRNIGESQASTVRFPMSEARDL